MYREWKAGTGKCWGKSIHREIVSIVDCAQLQSVLLQWNHFNCNEILWLKPRYLSGTFGLENHKFPFILNEDIIERLRPGSSDKKNWHFYDYSLFHTIMLRRLKSHSNETWYRWISYPYFVYRHIFGNKLFLRRSRGFEEEWSQPFSKIMYVYIAIFERHKIYLLLIYDIWSRNQKRKSWLMSI